MNRSDLINMISTEQSELRNADADRLVRTVFDTIAAHLVAGGRVELRGFGSFDVKQRPARTGRNPRTGSAVLVKEKTVVFFRAGADLRERVNAGAKADLQG